MRRLTIQPAPTCVPLSVRSPVTPPDGSYGTPQELINQRCRSEQRLRVTPAPTWMIMTSRLVVQVVANLVVSIIVLIVGAAVHHLALNVEQYLLILAVAVLGAAVFLGIGQGLVGLVRSTSAINALSRLLMAVLMLLGVLGGTGMLGDTLQTIADWSPVGALMTLFATVLNQTAWNIDDTYSLLACVGYIIVFAYVGIRLFRWETR